MAQTPAVFAYGEQNPISVVAAADTFMGQMVALGARQLPSLGTVKAGELNALATTGVWQFPKTSAGVFAAGATVCWDPAGNPAVGTAGSGAAVVSGAGLAILGFCVEAQGAGQANVPVCLTIAAATAPGTA